ncbi:MAG: site-2 protease family protein, partial [candidate division WOR-3 bacterium]
MAALLIGILITVHEFGHLAVAKLTGIPVEVFSIGFGRAILKWKRRETEYRISLVPLGGYIKMVGEDESATPLASSQPYSAGVGYSSKPLWVKVAVIAAGPASNLVLGFILMLTMYLAFGLKFLPPQLAINSDTNAAAAGLKTGDIVVSAAGESIPSYEKLESVLERNLGKHLTLIVLRGGQTVRVEYTVPSESWEIEPLQPAVIDRVRKGSP